MNSDWPSTLAEAVDRLMSTMTADELNALRDTPEGGLILQHFGLGMYIPPFTGYELGKEQAPVLAVVKVERYEVHHRWDSCFQQGGGAIAFRCAYP